MTNTTDRPSRNIPAWLILAVLALIVVTALAVTNWWNDRRSDAEMDQITNELVETLCPPSDPC